MKIGLLFQGIVLMLALGATADAQDAQTTSRHRHVVTSTTEDQYVEKYVYVTGSNIPRKVKIRRWGTDTTSPVAIYDQRDIRNSGHATTEDALKNLDPSISVQRH
jgi:hypothetical protein